ncbi:MAG: hypothetical protein AAGI08_09210 [Bacteroidota bacterium]
MPRLLLAVVLILTIAQTTWAQDVENPPAVGFNIEASDERAIELADEVVEAMGGRAAWDRTRYLSWTLFGRNHLWDRYTGRYRMERDSSVTVLDVNTGAGRVWRGGEEVAAGAVRDSLLDLTKRIWINDSYWLVMPFKLKDSGVTLRYLRADTTLDGRPAQVLQLTFEEVGVTPQNRYEIYVDDESRLMTQWDFYRSAEDKEPAFALPWGDYVRTGEVLIAQFHGATERGPIRVTNLSAPGELPDAFFETPAGTGLFDETD